MARLERREQQRGQAVAIPCTGSQLLGFDCCPKRSAGLRDLRAFCVMCQYCHPRRPVQRWLSHCGPVLMLYHESVLSTLA